MKYAYSLISLYLAIMCLTTAVSAKFAAILIQSEPEKNALLLAEKWDEQSNNQAIKIYLDSASKYLRLNNANQAAADLLKAGRLNIISGNRTQAEKSFKNAFNLLDNSSNDELKAGLLSELSHLSFDAGKLSEANQYLERALTLAKKSKNFSALGDVCYLKALYSYYNDEESKAIIFYQKSEENYRKAEDHSSAVKSIIGLSYVYILQSEFQKSLDVLFQALSESEQISDPRETALIFKALGSTYKQMYDYPKAIEYFLKSEQLFPDGLDMDEKAMLYNWLGGLYEDYGNWKLSIDYRQKAYDLFVAAHHKFGQTATLISLGRLRNLVGDNAAALKNIEQAGFLSQTSNDKYNLASIYEEKSNIYLQKNELEKASEALGKALELYDKKLYQRQIARVNNKMGWILERQNHFSEAKKYFTESLNLSVEVQDTLTESQTLFNLARLNYAENNSQSALDLVSQSINKAESSSSDLINAKLKSLYLSNVYERYELQIKLLMANRIEPDSITKALQTAEKSKARLILENLALTEANFTKDADTEMVKRSNEIRRQLNVKSDKLTDLLSSKTDLSAADKLSREINDLENQLEEIKGSFKQNSPVYSAIRNPAAFDVAEFQRDVLDEDSLFLEFSFGAEESYLWTVGKSEVASYVLPARVEIESRIKKLRELLKERELKDGESVEDFQTRIARADAQYTTISKELSGILFGQIADKLGKKRLIVVPDGELHYFPVSALPRPDSSEPILLTNETIYEPSAQTLSVLAKSNRQISPDAKNLLIFSDPVFTGDDARFSAENKPSENSNAQGDEFRFVESINNLPRLVASKDESETITQIVGASEADNYSGFAATRENLLNVRAENYKILHFATHGLTDEKRPELSGIVLSRFDEKGAKLDEFFRIQDIYGLNLNADLVVLSACETGIGKEIKGEGLMSLNNAFLQTGAKTVMASLWAVEDGATLELMKNFYAGIANENLTPSQALRSAQIKLRENPQYRSPFYWAAFTVQGDYRSVPQISRGFGGWLYGLPFLPLSFFGFYVYRKKKLFRRKAVSRAAV